MCHENNWHTLVYFEFIMHTCQFAGLARGRISHFHSSQGGGDFETANLLYIFIIKSINNDKMLILSLCLSCINIIIVCDNC